MPPVILTRRASEGIGSTRWADPRWRVGLVCALLIGIGVVPAAAQDSPLPQKKSLKPDATDEFFAKGVIPRLKITIEPADMQKLRQEPRKYVKAKVTENDATAYQEIGIKLKGAAGSFRGVDDRPALTLNFDKFLRQQTFHGLDKLHLNNSVQDPTYLQELISSDIALAAGVPAARATHARVWLNGRDLGFYGLKEGFDKKFVARHFANATGNLYDGGFCQEIEGNLEKDDGKGPDDRSDLKALVAACREPDPAKRWERVNETLDVEAFISFMAFELLTCHWDGYCNNRNNYRVYFDPANKKAYFFPHGMDQMFGDPNFGVLGVPGALVCQAVMQNPAWRSRYRDRLAEISKVLSPPDKLLARIDQVHARTRPVLAAMNEGLARDHDNQAKGLKDRIIARAKNLDQQNANVEPRPLAFNAQGIAAIPKWYARAETPDAKQEETQLDGRRAYLIATGPGNNCVASWRAKIVLAAGMYELRAQVRTADVVAAAGGPGAGAGLRISGGQRTNQVAGTTPWQAIKHEIVIGAAMQEIELVAELRATKGQVWFDAGSLQIAKVK